VEAGPGPRMGLPEVGAAGDWGLRSGTGVQRLGLAPAHELMDSERNFIGMRCAPRNDAFEFDSVVSDRADFHQLGFDSLRASHRKTSMAPGARGGKDPARFLLFRLIRRLVCVLWRQIIFTPFVRTQRPGIRRRSVLHGVHYRCLVELPLFDQFADALIFDVLFSRESLKVAGLAGRSESGFGRWLLAHWSSR